MDKDSMFLGLWDAIKTGAGMSLGALQEDIGNVQEGKLPRNLGKTVVDAMSAYSAPGTIGVIPKVPTYFNPHFEALDRMLEGFKGKYPPEQLQQYKETIINSMGARELAKAVPTGKFLPTTPSMAFGSK